MLKLIDVKKIYTTKAGDVSAMDGITVELPDSGMIFINGKSGSGKTTLLNVIGGLDGFDDGEIVIDGKNFSTFTDSDYDSYRNTFVGFIFQEYNLLPDYTVEKNIKIANELQGKETTKEKIKELMEEFDIAGLENRKISELSGGQKQRVAIVRSLVKDPKIIMADEPTGALDSMTGIQVVETLKKLSKDKLIIIVSHDLELAEKYADRIIRIVDGKIVEDVTITDTEIIGNLHADDISLTVKAGSNLNPNETQELLKAIRENKKINFTEKVIIRQKQKTKEVKDKKESGQVKLINSKMKFKSTAELGVKSLGVKPGRLIFTILLSVVAFAVFGLFDTIASYKDSKAIQNILKKSDYQAVSVYQEYDVNSKYYYNSSYSNSNLVKFTDEDIEKLSNESGFNFRPVYDLNDVYLSSYLLSNTVTHVVNGTNGEEKKVEVGKTFSTSVGALYYIPEVTGFVEFKESEIEYQTIEEVEYAKVIDKNGFNLKLVAGNLPKFYYDEKSGVANDREVAISKYLAESILYWNGGNEDETLMNVELIVGSLIKVDNVEYFITGVYDTGTTPKKYDELKTLPKVPNNSLGKDFKTYLNSGLYFNFIVGEGFTDYLRLDKKVNDLSKQRIASYYSQNLDFKFTFRDNSKPYELRAGSRDSKFYNVKDIDASKIVMFEEERNENISLNDDEVLINLEYLDELYKFEKEWANTNNQFTVVQKMEECETNFLKQYSLTATDKIKEEIKKYIDRVKYLYDSTDISEADYIKTLTISVSEGVGEKVYKVVGIYTGVDTDINKPTAYNINYPVAFTSKGLESIQVYPNQGVYTRVIAPVNTSRRATQYLAKNMTSGDIRLVWYGNTVLSFIAEGGEMIMQFANLFLYIAIVLAVFSIFMLYNYISASIVAKKQSIGVLRALGSGSKDIFLMFITESLIIAIINGILASIVASVGCIFVNNYIRNVMDLTIDFAIYGSRQVVIIMIASVVTATISSLLPIIKISKEKPVKLIREP